MATDRITKFYNLWRKMKCTYKKYNEEHPDSKITFFEDWNEYYHFEKWCIDQCNGDMSLFFVRLNEKDGFNPENCRFLNSTDARKLKAKNTIKLTYHGKTLSLTDWERETCIPRHVLSYRLNAGWNIDDIFKVPLASENYSNDKTDSQRLYMIWKSMRERCYTKSCKKYKDYGLKGIKLCDDWYNDFHSFEKWALQNGYKKDLTIERKNVNKDYCPENCTWITVEAQAKNRSNNHKITYNDRTMILQDWADEVGIDSATIRRRLKSGWSIEDALFTPKMKNQYK